MRRLLVLAALLVALPAGAVVRMDWVYVGEPGNAPDAATNCLNDAPDCGSVAYGYYISKYEVTNAQYAEFLNAKAASDPLGLYNTQMGSDAIFGGITQSGVSGSFTYTVKAGFEDKPVVYVSFFDALRFANWLNNGQESGDTETGTYTLLGGTETPSNGDTVTRNPGAIWLLPSENEWYKAAYYDHAPPRYYDYPAGTDAMIQCAAPGTTPNTANCEGRAAGALADVGSYTGSASPYGTFDQGGNVYEWNETAAASFPGGPTLRGSRGGGWGTTPATILGASYPLLVDPSEENSPYGFRVAPEPAHVLLVLTGGLVLLGASRRRAQGATGGGFDASAARARCSRRRARPLAARPASAATIVINNGLAPPKPKNVIGVA